MRKLTLLSFATLLLAAITAISCSRLFAVDIGAVTSDPRKFDNADVTIAGEVTGTVNVILARAYTVRDGTGEILVVTERAVPQQGAHVRVRGRVNQAFALGDRSLVVLLESGGN